MPIAGRLRGTPFAPYPMAFRAGCSRGAVFLSRPPGSAWASERDERARATSDRSCSAARSLSEFRVTDVHCAPAQFSFNSRGAIIYFFRPRSINNLTASDRLTSCSAAQRSTRAMSLPESRRPIIGRTPVAGRPRFFCLTDIDLAIFYV